MFILLQISNFLVNIIKKIYILLSLYRLMLDNFRSSWMQKPNNFAVFLASQILFSNHKPALFVRVLNFITILTKPFFLNLILWKLKIFWYIERLDENLTHSCNTYKVLHIFWFMTLLLAIVTFNFPVFIFLINSIFGKHFWSGYSEYLKVLFIEELSLENNIFVSRTNMSF